MRETPEAELQRRLLKRPTWHPSRYPGVCEACGEKVARGDAVTLMQTPHGLQWTCACVFMPEEDLRTKLAAMRRADDLLGA